MVGCCYTEIALGGFWDMTTMYLEERKNINNIKIEHPHAIGFSCATGTLMIHEGLTDSSMVSLQNVANFSRRSMLRG